MSEVAALTLQQTSPNRLVSTDTSIDSMLLDTAKFEHTWRVAQLFSKSDLVPAQYKGKPENCWIALSTAMRLGVEPFMFMQKSYVVSGKPGIESQLAIALVNASGVFSGPINYELKGDGLNRSCRAFAKRAGSGELCEATVSMTIANAEGWVSKPGSKWKTMPDQMLMYRSAMFLARTYAPECLLGLSTKEELEEINPDPKNVTPPQDKGSAVAAMLMEAQTPAQPKVDADGVIMEDLLSTAG